MRRFFFILCVFGALKLVKGQAFSVGNPCCNYSVVNYSFPSYSSGPFSGTSNTFTLDITGDLISDIDINSSSYNSGSAGMASYNGIRATSTTSIEIVYGNSVLTPCICGVAIKNVAFGTPFNASLNWSLTPTFSPGPEPNVNYYWYKPSVFASYCGEQTSSFYIAFRKKLPGDTIYGWILMDTNKPGKILSYAYTCTNYTATPSTSTITTAPSTVCKGDSIYLSANPSGGIFFGSGVSGNYFKSKNLAAGTYTVNYVPSTNNCAINSSSIVFTVMATSITNTQTAICSGESLTLTATPSGGYFSGINVTGNIFSPVSTGTFATIYTYTHSPSCILTTSVNLVSNACVGINELSSRENGFLVFPNPSNGEFEIKGIKEETIFITNELGQIVKKVELNSENNFSLNATNLPSGIYFVGNKFYRQKIVVIK